MVSAVCGLQCGVLGLIGCGDGAADAAYRGEPLDEIELAVTYATTFDVIDKVVPQATLLWIDEDGGFVAADVDGIVVAKAAPAQVTVQVFDGPPPGIERAHKGIDGLVAFGQVGIFDDQDLDNRWDPKSEDLLGLSGDLVVVYSSLGASGETIGTFGKGFHHAAPAPCPEELRLLGRVQGSGSIEVSHKLSGAFVLECPPPAGSACAPLSAVRYTCRLYPENYRCDECAAAVFPADATDAVCDAWLAACLVAYPVDGDECRGEHSVCVAGEPPCDRACLCGHLFDGCLETADETTCSAKYGASCTDP